MLTHKSCVERYDVMGNTRHVRYVYMYAILIIAYRNNMFRVRNKKKGRSGHQKLGYSFVWPYD